MLEFGECLQFDRFMLKYGFAPNSSADSSTNVSSHTQSVKNGILGGIHGYKCQSGPHNFVIGDQPSNKSTQLKPNASVLLDALGEDSFRFLAQLFDVATTTAYNWLRPAAES